MKTDWQRRGGDLASDSRMFGSVERSVLERMRRAMQVVADWMRMGLPAGLALAAACAPALAQTPAASGQGGGVRPTRDGRHDFDWEIGTWRTHLQRLLRPLSGSTTWVQYEGTTVVRPVWNGSANLLELEVDGPVGHLEALSLRLYDSTAHQWTLNFANSVSGQLSQPTFGAFVNGRGEFYDMEPYGGRMILVRFEILDVTRDSARFEQSFSADGGSTWELNWVATDTREPEAP